MTVRVASPSIRHNGPVPDPTNIRRRANWTGGYYELAIRLGPTDDDRLDGAVTALWSSAGLARPRLRDSRAEVQVTGASLIEHHSLVSVARPPGAGGCVCRVDLTRDEDTTEGIGADPVGTTEQDWLTLSLPLGALNEADRRVGGFPFEDTPSRPWREPLEDWLIDAATDVFAQVPFAGAVTGFEVAGFLDDSHAPGSVGYLRPGADGQLRVRRVTRW